jgi:hypothetical protein
MVKNKKDKMRKFKFIPLKDKAAFSLASWAEVALFTTLFMLLFISLIAFMNVTYDGSYDGSFGLSTSISTTQGELSDYQDTLQQNVKSGQATSSGEGISLTTTWNIITGGLNIMWTFLTGGFIEQVVGLLRLPAIVGTILRILFVLSIGFILIKLILKINP